MEKFLEKIEEYNIFNYLLPGVIFVYVLKFYVGIDIFQENIIEMGFIYYFIGSIISRIGSIVLEPVLKKIKFIKYSTHKEYINATKVDKTIEKLLMNNNMYRTLCSGFILLILIKLLSIILEYLKWPDSFIYTILIILGIILYLFSYKKQTKYIVSRIERTKDK